MGSLAKSVTLLLLGALLFGCNAGERAADDPSHATTADRPFALPALVEAALNPPPGADTPALLDPLPPPRKIETKAVKNRHDSTQTDTLRMYFYEGLSFTVYHVSASGKDLLEEIHVSGPEYETAEGVRVGLSRAQVKRLRGTPDTTTDDNFVYQLSDVVSSALTVHFESDTVSAMDWDFYVD